MTSAREERLREALRAGAHLVTPETLDPDRSFTATRRRAQAGRRRPRRAAPEPPPRRRRPLVPVLVIAVVLAVVGGTTALTRLAWTDGDRPVPAGGPTATADPGVVDVTATRFFVTARPGGGLIPPGQPAPELTIRDARTGEVTAAVPMPNAEPFCTDQLKDGCAWGPVSGTADPSVFFAVANGRLYRLVVDGVGQVASFTEVDVAGARYQGDGFAVSPDGRRVASVARSDEPGNFFMSDTIEIVSLDDRQVRTYQPNDVLFYFKGLSWSADGRYLVFEAARHPDTSSGREGLWILDTRLGGEDLFANSRQVVPATPDDDLSVLGADAAAAVLGPDGHRLYVTLASWNQLPGRVTTRLVELDAATGRQLRVLLELRREWTGAWPIATIALARKPSGHLLLLDGDGSGATVYDIDPRGGGHSRVPLAHGNPSSIA
ncbi:PD40 domain-containing protein [Frankia sp. CNm7]|uniref:PD40 domain-containing protein n=1 Tax=Frankia nepalensis TaxID=1836974 RepID=A0A937UQD4_9ACTN|nr:PD40 domain-containing protein [Frankia nepalensis]MBL7495638.1 PD40 domain-containing protein [Frankia nepalensis]MBL7508884.1 PD40 domain-containing protein [Frankia nepalensis]MBL7520332.1 PD40 domain-containing protein [Frankia nepalensis]MBL7630107.1 PD40 domain-containing protein [Frankia nepalensis]